MSRTLVALTGFATAALAVVVVAGHRGSAAPGAVVRVPDAMADFPAGTADSVASGAAHATTADAAASTAATPPASRVTFEANCGQAPADARFVARTGRGAALVLADGFTHALPGGGVARTRFVGASGGGPMAEAVLPGRTHYLRGADRSRWVRDVSSSRRVRWPGVWPGIDAVARGNGTSVEYDFVVAPGADARDIRVEVSSGEGVRPGPDGGLVAGSGNGALVHRRPVAWQDDAEGRRDVACAFDVVESSPGRLVASFTLGDHDPARPVVIDPVITYLSFVGGSAGDEVSGIAVAPDGSRWIGGRTSSIDFPTPGGTGVTIQGDDDNFVMKLAPDGHTVLWTTVFGGTGAEDDGGMAVDLLTGEPTLFCRTESSDYPVTAGAFQSAFAGLGPEGYTQGDGAVTRLLADGSDFVFSTYLGGEYGEFAHACAAGPGGLVAVCGRTDSDDFPLARPAQGRPGGELSGPADGYIAVFARDGRAVFSTYVGGWNPQGQSESIDHIRDVAFDAKGNVWGVGWSTADDFPIRGKPLKKLHLVETDGYDAVVVGVARTGGRFLWSSYLGGTGSDHADGVCLDAAGRVYVTGSTDSADFPIASAIQETMAGGYSGDAFVSVIDTTKGRLLTSTYLGGPDDENGLVLHARVRVDPLGRTIVTGSTESTTGFPVVDPVQAVLYRATDGFVTILGPQARGPVLFSTYIGGRAIYDDIAGVALDAGGRIHLGIATAQTMGQAATADAFKATSDFDDGLIVTLDVEPGALGAGTARFPKSLDCGKTAVGGSKRKNLALKNGSKKAGLIVTLPVPAVPFRFDPAVGRVVIPAGKTVNVPVVFEPVTAGQVSIPIEVATSDPARPAVSVTLSGTGK